MTDNELPLSPPPSYRDNARSRLLRKRPSGDALRWAEQVCSARVTAIRWFRGGSSSAVHALWFDDGSRAVLRRYVRPEVIDEEPDIVDREVNALRTAAMSGVAVPAVIAADAKGTEAGVPSMLLTRVRGRVQWPSAIASTWLEALADPPAEFAAVQLPRDHGLTDFAPYAPPSWEAPAHLSDHRLWDRAVDLFHSPPHDTERVLSHRDFHPGNVLWLRGQVSGVVDWQSACVGPASVDPAWCRLILIRRYGLEAGDRYVSAWEDASGRTYHPWAEAVMLVDVIGWSPRRDRSIADFELTLAQRLAELGV